MLTDTLCKNTSDIYTFGLISPFNTLSNNFDLFSIAICTYLIHILIVIVIDIRHKYIISLTLITSLSLVSK